MGGIKTTLTNIDKRKIFQKGTPFCGPLHINNRRQTGIDLSKRNVDGHYPQHITPQCSVFFPFLLNPFTTLMGKNKKEQYHDHKYTDAHWYRFVDTKNAFVQITIETIRAQTTKRTFGTMFTPLNKC